MKTKLLIILLVLFLSKNISLIENGQATVPIVKGSAIERVWTDWLNTTGNRYNKQWNLYLPGREEWETQNRYNESDLQMRLIWQGAAETASCSFTWEDGVPNGTIITAIEIQIRWAETPYLDFNDRFLKINLTDDDIELDYWMLDNETGSKTPKYSWIVGSNEGYGLENHTFSGLNINSTEWNTNLTSSPALNMIGWHNLTLVLFIEWYAYLVEESSIKIEYLHVRRIVGLPTPDDDDDEEIREVSQLLALIIWSLVFCLFIVIVVKINDVYVRILKYKFERFRKVIHIFWNAPKRRRKKIEKIRRKYDGTHNRKN